MSRIHTTSATRMVTRSQTSSLTKHTSATTDNSAPSDLSKKNSAKDKKKASDATLHSMSDDHAIDIRASSNVDGKRYAVDFWRDEDEVMKARVYEQSGVVLRIYRENGLRKAMGFQIKEFAREGQD